MRTLSCALWHHDSRLNMCILPYTTIWPFRPQLDIARQESSVVGQGSNPWIGHFVDGFEWQLGKSPTKIVSAMFRYAACSNDLLIDTFPLALSPRCHVLVGAPPRTFDNSFWRLIELVGIGNHSNSDGSVHRSSPSFKAPECGSFVIARSQWIGRWFECDGISAIVAGFVRKLSF